MYSMLTVVSPTARSEVNWRVTVSASTSYVTVTSVGRKGVGRKGVGRKGVGRKGVGRKGVGRKGVVGGEIIY